LKKLWICLILLYANINFAKVLETRCISEDCFKYGWSTVEPGTDYQLNCKCTQGDCKNAGWKSVDNRDSRYFVRCKTGGCFKMGWISRQIDKGKILIDVVTCKNESCLTDGWDIISSYGRGGVVTCKNNDCRQFGGISFWRGKNSETSCIDSDCYKYGWMADIED